MKKTYLERIHLQIHFLIKMKIILMKKSVKNVIYKNHLMNSKNVKQNIKILLVNNNIIRIFVKNVIE